MEHTSAAGAEKPAQNAASTPHVDIDYFDPEGVLELRKVLSRDSQEQKHKELSRATTRTATDATLAGDAENFDFEKTLRSKLNTLSEAGIRKRELGVMFENLRVVGLGATVKYQSTFGSFFDPRTYIETIKTLRHPPVRDILSGFNGVIRPGEMLLVLGSPGSGCTTFLKTIANQRAEYHAVEGEVHYDSFSPAEVTAHYRGDVIYCPEDDVHFPTLTVHDTLRFAAKTRMPQARPNGETKEEYITLVTDIVETLFGLRHVRNTPVGDNRIRGVSGGEKKRVSIGEALATRHLVGAWDNSTRGLDASTALEFVRALRIATDVVNLSTTVSIYQAGEQLYDLFDKVCVIYEGKMAYFGPAKEARQYFIDMGYEPAHRQTTADFLVAVTDPAGRIPRAGVAHTLPRTASDFATYFEHSAAGQANHEDIKGYRAEFVGQSGRANDYMLSARAERAKRARQASPYTVSIPQQTAAVMVRSIQMLKGNPAEVVVMTLSFIFQAIIVGTLFEQLPEQTDAYFSRGSLLFFCVLFPALTTLSEIPTRFAQRPIVDRHKKNAMYHPFIEAVSLTLIDIPIMLFTIVMFAIPMYFIVRLQRTASQFFIYLLLLFIITFVMKTWYRLLASIFKSPPPALTVAGLSTLLAVLYTGYTIPRPSMIGALRWITHINPLRYAYAGLLVNEFHTLEGTCSMMVPSGPGYENIPFANQVCAIVTAESGRDRVNGMRFVMQTFGYRYGELWRNFGILCGFAGGFLAIFLLFSEWNTSVAGETVVAIFKRGSVAPAEFVRSDKSNDEEKVHPANTESDRTRTKEQVQPSAVKNDAVFSWQHLDYSVPIPGGQKQLLNDISGYVVPGKLTALMGESGAGKTTLLNVLSERQNSGIVTGFRFVNGQALPTDFQAQTGYVQQMDTHLETMTIREALLFSAKMRQPLSVPLAEKEEYVEKCLKMCNLEHHSDAIVGSLGVEHRKRTTIGVELAAKPELLLFLDEPTSGLDSQSAWAIMDFMRSLADSGVAILCTIHQPSAELFMRFDRLLLLKKGGKTVYFGDLGENADTLISYFQRNGGRSIANWENPAEYMLDVIGAGATANSTIEWNAVWRESPEAVQLQHNLERIHEECRARPTIVAAQKGDFATPWIYQAMELCRRAFQSYWRTPSYVLAKLALNIFGGLLIGFTFWMADDTQQGTQNKVFTYYLICILSVPMSNQIHLPFLHFRSIYEIRERACRTYSWSALVASQIIVELPWNFIGSTLFFFCSFWSVGLENSRAAFTYLLFGVFFPFYITTIGQAVAAISPNAEISAILSSSVFSFIIVFNGIMQPFFQFPTGWKWMYWVTPFHYLVSGLVGQVIGHQEIHCSADELVTLEPPAGMTCGSYMADFLARKGGYLMDAAANNACQFCSTRTTDEFLQSRFNIKYSEHWWFMGIFIGYILFNIFAIFALTWFFRVRTWSITGFIRGLGRKRS